MRILVADDNLQAQHVLSLILRRSGHECVVVSTGKAGLAQLRQEPKFDAIVSDVLMPDMDGFQFCWEVKNNAALKDLPFLFYSATYAEPQDRELGLALGAAAYLVKPSEPHQILKALMEATQPNAKDASSTAQAQQDQGPDSALFRQYNSRLVNKLESKMLELGQANRDLEKANRDLMKANRALSEEIARRVAAEKAASALQLRLFESQKMETLGVLAGGVAHDFNNLLTIIIGNTSSIAHSLPAGHPMQECLTGISSAANRAAERTSQILAFSRRGNEHLTAQPMHELVDLARVVGEAVQLLRGLIPPNVRLDLTLPLGLTYVSLDSVKIHQIVLNLGVNAIQAMTKGGTLSFNVAQGGPPPTVQGGEPVSSPTYALLSVRDTGVGMDLETQRRAFEPFFTTKERGKGTGLGLPMVHSIVTDHGGEIVVDSRQGHGTRIDVYLMASHPPTP